MSGIGALSLDRRYGGHGGQHTEWELSTGDSVYGFDRLAEACRRPEIARYITQYIGDRDVALPNGEVCYSKPAHHSIALREGTPIEIVMQIAAELLALDGESSFDKRGNE